MGVEPVGPAFLCMPCVSLIKKSGRSDPFLGIGAGFAQFEGWPIGFPIERGAVVGPPGGEETPRRNQNLFPRGRFMKTPFAPAMNASFRRDHPFVEGQGLSQLFVLAENQESAQARETAADKRPPAHIAQKNET